MFTPNSYTIAAALFTRLLGFVFLFAFGALLFQIRGLIGKNGILPLKNHLSWLQKHYPRRCYVYAPTLFWFNHSDAALTAVVGIGVVLSVLLMLGLWPAVMLFLLYCLYLSLVVAGQDFLSFGWEGFLLEVTANAFFLNLMSPPNPMVWISLNLVLFRFHLQGGAVKLQSGDPHWRNLTAIAYHYQSQPIPNFVAWYAHKLPLWFHKLSTLLMFVIELIVPFALFGPDWMRLGAFFALAGLQVAIWATGNFSYLNYLTVVLCTILIANIYMPEGLSPSVVSPAWPGVDYLCTGFGTIMTILQLMQLWNHFAPNPLFNLILGKFCYFYLCNRYGIFAVMTTTRNEIIFEGSEDGITWKEYAFCYKPSEVTRRPRRIAPYQPRLDWQAWFLPFGGYRYDAWLSSFLYHLLKGTPEVLSLLRVNPFPNAPPQYVRSLMYEYVFSTFSERKKYDWWWRRTLVGTFTSPMHLKNLLRGGFPEENADTFE